MNKNPEKTESIRIGIIEDDAPFLKACESALSKELDIRVVLSASEAEVFLKHLKPFHHIDLLLLDIHLPGQSGLAMLQDIQKRLPETSIIMYTIEEEPEALFQAMSRGAEGYLLKNRNFKQLAQQLRICKAGGAIISPMMARYLIDYFRPRLPEKGESPLGKRDYELLQLLSEGWTYEYIARQMEISVNGVRYYIRKLYKRMNVNSRHEATRKFLLSRNKQQ